MRSAQAEAFFAVFEALLGGPKTWAELEDAVGPFAAYEQVAGLTRVSGEPISLDGAELARRLYALDKDQDGGAHPR